jgi:SAM-dependent methyltransferase
MTMLSDLARYYDVLTDWEKRLDREMPLLRKTLQEAPKGKVLVAGCGTGGHVVALAKEGLDVVGIDLDPAMVAATQKKLEAAAEGIQRAGGEARVVLRAIEEAMSLGEHFAAALCLGNTLPNLSVPRQLETALRSLYEVLLPGGVFFTQNLNYDKRWREKVKWFPLLSGRTTTEEVILFKVAEYGTDFLDFHAIFLVKPSENKNWEYRVNTTRQIPLFERELRGQLERIGFEIVSTWADYSRAAFDAQNSGDLLLVARRGSSFAPAW